MQTFKISELKPHPRNTEFFDDMSGEKWSEFLQSIKDRGVIEPVVITQDKVIVSGHQRVRACKELGISEVICTPHVYDNEDQVIQDLLETNIRQRGDVGGSAKKVGLRIKELERIYGIKNGGDRSKQKSINDYCSKTQSDIASDMGIELTTYKNYKLLTEMIPELEDLVDTGIVTKTTALSIMRQLSPEEQEELLSSIPTDKKYTQAQMNETIKKYKERISELESQPATIMEVDKPETLQKIQDLQSDLKNAKLDYNNMVRQFQNKVSELQDLRAQVDVLKSNEQAEQFNKKLKDDTIFFCAGVADFIKKYGGYVWITEHINELPEYERKSYISAITEVNNWANVMLENLNRRGE